MRITDLKCAVIGHNPVVRLVTDEGLSGYGQVEASKPYLKTHVLFYKPLVLGEDPTDVERVMLKIRRLGGAPGGVGRSGGPPRGAGPRRRPPGGGGASAGARAGAARGGGAAPPPPTPPLASNRPAGGGGPGGGGGGVMPDPRRGGRS